MQVLPEIPSENSSGILSENPLIFFLEIPPGTLTRMSPRVFQKMFPNIEIQKFLRLTAPFELKSEIKIPSFFFNFI